MTYIFPSLVLLCIDNIDLIQNTFFVFIFKLGGDCFIFSLFIFFCIFGILFTNLIIFKNIIYICDLDYNIILPIHSRN